MTRQFLKAFWKLQSSPTQAASDLELTDFHKMYPETAKYLDNISDGCWRLFEFNDLKIKTFGHKTSNLAEINRMVTRNQDITEGAAKSMAAVQQNDTSKNLYATALSTSFPFTYLVDFVNHRQQTKWAQRVTLYEVGGGWCTCGLV